MFLDNSDSSGMFLFKQSFEVLVVTPARICTVLILCYKRGAAHDEPSGESCAGSGLSTMFKMAARSYNNQHSGTT